MSWEGDVTRLLQAYRDGDRNAFDPRHAAQLLSIDHALTRLAEHNERLARIFECRFFAGLSEEETALALDSSLRTVQRDWLKEELGNRP